MTKPAETQIKAVQLAPHLKPRTMKPKKGKGSYTRKKRKPA